MDDIRTEKTLGRVRIEWIGACGGFLRVGPSVAVSISLRVKGRAEELAVVLGSFP
jgi:hypothetical protein